MAGIKYILEKDNMCVIALVIFYENRTMNPMKVFRVLIFVLYSFIENYGCIDCICCQYKKLSIICSDKLFADMSYNEFLGIGIPIVLMNFISYHVLMKDENSTVLLSCFTLLV